jgi:hypothetical protein
VPAKSYASKKQKENFLTIFTSKKICPRSLDKFVFSPSIGNLGGLLTMWNSSIFEGTIVQSDSNALTVRLSCRIYNSSFHLTNIYGPSNSM